MPIAICGILGGGPDAAQTLDAMLDALADSGPARTARTAGAVRFGYRHVPAGDADAAALVVDRDAGLVLAADARIDDRGALCDTLGIPHPQRAGLADADLVLRAFVRWRAACPAHLVGDYAFAVWDGRRGSLFCARDHVGARPFYYSLEDAALADGRFVFASAVDAVLAAPGVSAALDEEVVAASLSSVWPDTATRTFYRAVRKLPAGHTLVVEPEAGPNAGGAGRLRVRLERYWRPEEIPAARPAADDAYAEEFLDLYGKAVRDRLHGGPVGVHLSGGLDSSSVAVLAARALRRQGRPAPPAFSWLPALDGAPPEPAHAREYALVDAVCAQEGLQVYHGAPGPGEVVDVLRRDGTLPGAGVQFNEEVVLRRAAGMGVRVLLSGCGGDECVSFNGRGHWQHLLLSGRWRALAADCHAEDGAWRMLVPVVLSLLHPALPATLNRWRGGMGARRRWFIDPAFARRTKPLVKRAERLIGLRRTQVRFLRDGHLSEFQEQWRARGVRRGIEYRFPLLDRRLLEFALSLPPDQFRRPGYNRWLMRHGLRRVLPPAVCWNRRKDDPARAEPVMDAIAAALPAVRRRLAGRTPSRAAYVDMPGLLEYLDTDRFRAAPRFAPLRAALQFLDF